MARKSKCSTEDCNGDEKSLGLCGNCYQRAWYWSQKTLRERAQHLKKLGIRHTSLKDLIGLVPVNVGKRKVG